MAEVIFKRYNAQIREGFLEADMARGVRPEQDVVIQIALWTKQKLTATQIESELQRDERFSDRVPELRAIQRWASRFRSYVQGVPWRLTDREFTPKEVRYLLRCLGEVIWATEGRKVELDIDEARLIARIGLATTVMPPYAAYVLANEYLVRQELGRPDESGLDAYLAFREAFWSVEDPDDPTVEVWRRRLRDAVNGGWISDVPVWYQKDERNEALLAGDTAAQTTHLRF